MFNRPIPKVSMQSSGILLRKMTSWASEIPDFPCRLLVELTTPEVNLQLMLVNTPIPSDNVIRKMLCRASEMPAFPCWILVHLTIPEVNAQLILINTPV